jgi:hypothetical protein
MAIQDISATRKYLAGLLEADTEIGTTMQFHVYESRQLPQVYDREIAVFSAGSSPNSYAVLGSATGGPAFQFSIWWLVKFAEGKLDVAEDISDSVENAIYRVLLEENYKTAYWRKILFPQLSLRPLAPGGVQNAHFGRILTRMMVNV